MVGGEEARNGVTEAPIAEGAIVASGETYVAETAVRVRCKEPRSSMRAATLGAIVWDAQHAAEDAFTEVPVSGTPG